MKSILLGYGVFFMMAIVVPGWLLFNIEGIISSNVVLMFCIVIWSQLRLVFTGLTGQRRLTLMCFYTFIYVFFGVQPLLSIAVKKYPNGIELSDGLVSHTIFLIIIGILLFEGGYFVRSTMKSTILQSVRRPRPLATKMLWAGGIVAVLMTAVVMSYYGPGVFIALRGFVGPTIFWQREVASYTESVLVIYSIRVFAAVMLFFAVYMWKHRDMPLVQNSSSLKSALIFLTVLNLLVSNPLAAPRLWSGSIILTVFFILMRWRGTRSFLGLSTASCLALLILFAGTDPRRFAAIMLKEESITFGTVGRLISSSVQSLSFDANFDAFAMLATTTQYTVKYGLSWGNQLLLPAFFWIPRSVWESKPIGTGDIVADYLQLSSLNVSAPLWAEGYINLGLMGVLIALFSFGWFARVCDDFHVKTIKSPVMALQAIVSSYFSANTFILLRGDLTSGTMYLQLVVVLCFLILFMNRFFRIREG